MLCQDNQLLCTMRYVFLGQSIGEMGGQVYTVGEVIKATNIDANFHHFSLHTESPITFELV